MQTNFTVVFDACVLYPAPVRDLLMRLTLADLFRAKWTNQIHDEWIRNLLINRTDLTRDRIENIRALMNSSVRDCLVEDYESLIPSVNIPDADDRHVVAAAIKCGADLIVTYNLKDFPSEELKRFNLEVQHPDEFIVNQIDLDVAKVCEALRSQRAALINPKLTQDELLESLLKNELITTVSQLRGWKQAF